MQASFRESEQAAAHFSKWMAWSLEISYVVDHLILQRTADSYPQWLKGLKIYKKKKLYKFKTSRTYGNGTKVLYLP